MAQGSSHHIDRDLRETRRARPPLWPIRLIGEYRYIDLPRTENDRPRRVPLSVQAVASFKSSSRKASAEAIASTSILPVETGRGIIYAFRDAVSESCAICSSRRNALPLKLRVMSKTASPRRKP